MRSVGSTLGKACESIQLQKEKRNCNALTTGATAQPLGVCWSWNGLLERSRIEAGGKALCCASAILDCPHPQGGDVAFPETTPFCSEGCVCEHSHSKFLTGDGGLDSEEGNLGETPQHPLHML